MAEVPPSESTESVSRSSSSSRVLKVSPEEITTDTTDCSSVKVICLGDSAVGKSK